MRKVILGLAITLDGYIEGPNGEYDWCFTDQDYGMKEFLDSIDAIFFGSKSYTQLMSMEGGAEMFSGKTNYLFTRGNKMFPGNYEVISGDFVAQVESIRQRNGKNIWLFGGAELTASLMQHNLVDELWMSIHPILLGKGKPLFKDMDARIKLKLLSSQQYETGLLSVRYALLKE